MDVIGQLAQADLVTCLHVAEQALRRARQFPLSGEVADGELVSSVQRLEALGRMCTGQKLRLVAEIAERDAHRGRDAATTEDLLATTLHLSRGEAKAQAELAAGLVAVPKVAEALADGRLGVGQAQVTVRKAEELKGRDDAAELIAGLDATAARAGQTLDRGRLGRQLDAQIAREAPDALKSREQRAWFVLVCAVGPLSGGRVFGSRRGPVNLAFGSVATLRSPFDPTARRPYRAQSRPSPWPRPLVMKPSGKGVERGRWRRGGRHRGGHRPGR